MRNEFRDAPLAHGALVGGAKISPVSTSIMAVATRSESIATTDAIAKRVNGLIQFYLDKRTENDAARRRVIDGSFS